MEPSISKPGPTRPPQLGHTKILMAHWQPHQVRKPRRLKSPSLHRVHLIENLPACHRALFRTFESRFPLSHHRLKIIRLLENKLRNRDKPVTPCYIPPLPIQRLQMPLNPPNRGIHPISQEDHYTPSR